MASWAANATNQSSTGSKSSGKNDDIFDRLDTLNKCDAVPPKIVQECVFHALEETIIERNNDLAPGGVTRTISAEVTVQLGKKLDLEQGQGGKPFNTIVLNLFYILVCNQSLSSSYISPNINTTIYLFAEHF